MKVEKIDIQILVKDWDDEIGSFNIRKTEDEEYPYTVEMYKNRVDLSLKNSYQMIAELHNGMVYYENRKSIVECLEDGFTYFSIGNTIKTLEVEKIAKTDFKSAINSLLISTKKYVVFRM